MREPATPVPETDWSVLPGALALGLALGTVGWWLTRDVSERRPAVTGFVTRVDLPVPGGGLAPLVADPPAAGRAPAVRAAVALPASGTPGALDGAWDEMAPVQPPLRQRPPYLSPDEWAALQTTAARSAQTEQALVDLVNRVRLMRLARRWADSPVVGAGAAMRVAAAQALLRELPVALALGALDASEARRHLPDWLADAEPDATERARQAQVMADVVNGASPPRGADLPPLPFAVGPLAAAQP